MPNTPMVWLMCGRSDAPAPTSLGGMNGCGEMARCCLPGWRSLRAEQSVIVERVARREKRPRGAFGSLK
jgi:hypothetical protein